MLTCVFSYAHFVCSYVVMFCFLFSCVYGCVFVCVRLFMFVFSYVDVCVCVFSYVHSRGTTLRSRPKVEEWLPPKCLFFCAILPRELRCTNPKILQKSAKS